MFFLFFPCLLLFLHEFTTKLLHNNCEKIQELCGSHCICVILNPEVNSYSNPGEGNCISCTQVWTLTLCYRSAICVFSTVLSCRCKALCRSRNTVLGETQKQKNLFEWVSISHKCLVLHVSACPDLPHPARRPLQILPVSGKILLCGRHIGFQVKYTPPPACRRFMFIYSCASSFFATTVPTRRKHADARALFHFLLAETAPSSPTSGWSSSCLKRSRSCSEILPWAGRWCSASSGSSCTTKSRMSRRARISTRSP